MHGPAMKKYLFAFVFPAFLTCPIMACDARADAVEPGRYIQIGNFRIINPGVCGPCAVTSDCIESLEIRPLIWRAEELKKPQDGAIR